MRFLLCFINSLHLYCGHIAVSNILSETTHGLGLYDRAQSSVWVVLWLALACHV